MDILRRIDILLNESSPYVSLNVMFDDHYAKREDWVHFNVDTNEVTYSHHPQIPIGSTLDDEYREIAKNIGVNLLPVRY